MTIVCIRNGWKHTDFGGAEDLTLSLCSELNKNGYDSLVLSGTESILNDARKRNTPNVTGPFNTYKILNKHRFVQLPLFLIKTYSDYRWYKDYFQKTKPDVVHCNSFEDQISATAACKKLGIPIVWSDHGELKNTLPFKIKPPFGLPGLLLRKYITYASNIFIFNPSDKQLIQEISPSANLLQATNGVLELKLKKTKEYTFVFASRLAKEKGIFELVDAFSMYQQEHPSANLLISGNGEQEEDLKNYINQQKIPGITLESYSDESITKGQIFILPTYTEAQSLAVIKAMMLRVPIITTNIDGNTHFLTNRHNALLVETKSSESLYSCMKELSINIKMQESLIKNARNDYDENYNFSKIVRDQYIPVYKSLR